MFVEVYWTNVLSNTWKLILDRKFKIPLKEVESKMLGSFFLIFGVLLDCGLMLLIRRDIWPHHWRPSSVYTIGRITGKAFPQWYGKESIQWTFQSYTLKMVSNGRTDTDVYKRQLQFTVEHRSSSKFKSNVIIQMPINSIC